MNEEEFIREWNNASLDRTDSFLDWMGFEAVSRSLSITYWNFHVPIDDEDLLDVRVGSSYQIAFSVSIEIFNEQNPNTAVEIGGRIVMVMGNANSDKFDKESDKIRNKNFQKTIGKELDKYNSESAKERAKAGQALSKFTYGPFKGDITS